MFESKCRNSDAPVLQDVAQDSFRIECERTLKTRNKALALQCKYKKSPMTKERARRILERLDHSMETQQLYTDNTLSLPKLAAAAGLRSHDVSQVLNQMRGQSFFDYLASFRVSCVVEKLKCDARLSIFDAAMEAGFNSKSTFYNAFKRERGMTPAAYRRHVIGPATRFA